MIYLDANATEPLRPEAREAVLGAMDQGNPSSIHQAGRGARRVLEQAREAMARFFKAQPADVIFCSGATEANALAVHALGAGRKVLTGATEHDAVRAAAPGSEVVPVLADGMADLAALEALLVANPGALVCLMAANNETGVLHDIAAAAALCNRHGALLHVDAVQAVGRCNLDWLGLGAASFALSGHKFGGPMGAGALVVSPGRAVAPLLRGGGQEQGRRGGTPALPAIAGLAAALGGAYEASRISAYRDEIEAFCTGLGAVALGARSTTIAEHHLSGAARRAGGYAADRARYGRKSPSLPGRRAPPASWRRAMCWRRWVLAHWRGRRFASRCPGM